MRGCTDRRRSSRSEGRLCRRRPRRRHWRSRTSPCIGMAASASFTTSSSPFHGPALAEDQVDALLVVASAARVGDGDRDIVQTVAVVVARRGEECPPRSERTRLLSRGEDLRGDSQRRSAASSVTSLSAVLPKITRAMVTGTETSSRTAAMKSLEPLPSMSPSGMTTGWSAPPAGVIVNVSAVGRNVDRLSHLRREAQRVRSGRIGPRRGLWIHEMRVHHMQQIEFRHAHKAFEPV